ncbi:MAG: L-seryl-tRNA(Sec) selenium transferase [Actinomycetota bacterium]|nr:L-seryl-tRNA(Sec) selenium transferase [Actinomycetota bacterium]
MTDDTRRRIPRTDAVLADPRVAPALQRLSRRTVKAAVVEAQQRVRSGSIAPEAVVDAVLAALPETATTLRPVINATGVVLHTNLGRAPLSAAASEAVTAAAGYVDVEYDLASGRRADRGRGTLEALRASVPATEAALVVNNGAGALILAITALARGREVLVSRGELVEIGDGFRLPELLESTGARIREVGTTNRTHARDYADAIGPQTGCILKVHPSNFRLEGFTSSAAWADLARLGVPLIVDIGSGLLAPDPLLPDEPDATTALTAGAAAVTSSGDKLLGGPQAGIVLGSAAVVGTLRRHPLYRALRVDKLTLAALEATLRAGDSPTRGALAADRALLRRRADEVAQHLTAAGVPAEVVPSAGAVGGGGAPGVALPGWAVAVAESLATPLRLGRPPVVGRVERGRCLLDLRCVPLDRDGDLAAAVVAVAAAVPELIAVPDGT